MVRVLVTALALCFAPQAAGKAITPQEASKHVGEAVTVQGRVAAVRVSAKGDTTFIDFGPAYPHQTFTAVIFEAAADQFLNVQAVKGKTVLVRGTVRLYHQKPEIVLEHAEQLNVIV